MAEQPQRVLVIEDDLVNQEILRRMLVHLGAEVTVVGHGRDAAAARARRTFDLVLSDLHLPDTDGIELVHHLRAEAGARTMVIGLTGDVSAVTHARMLAAGMDAVLSKPVTLNRLKQLLASMHPPA